MTPLKIGTRGSELALFQARTVAQLLQTATGRACEIEIIRTSGDRLAEAPLSQVGGKRLFVKEIEDALLAADVDIAVHSSKDMPAVLPEGLVVGAVLPREDPHDAVVLPVETGGSFPLDRIVERLGDAPRIGTSSVRRAAQLIDVFPGARFTPVRGNLDTRLRKLDRGDYDALVLAAAGLRRLDQAARISALVPAERCVPAPGQGIIAVEARAADRVTLGLLAAINDAPAAAALAAERAVVVRLGGGCQMPIGAYAAIDGVSMTMTAIVTSLDGSQAARAQGRGPVSGAERLGVETAELLISRGAREILAGVERARVVVEGLQP